MFNQGGAMRATAARYLQLSRDTKDRRERGKASRLCGGLCAARTAIEAA
jgi:hypothetical protein